MKRMIVSALVATVMVIVGCATDQELVKTASVSARGDVFQEVAEEGPIPRGYADLLIVASLKTHKPYKYEKKTHGTADFKILINIDGQAVWMEACLKEENIEPRGLRDSEAGEGMRYVFRKHLRLQAGMHKVIVAIPEDVVAVERVINLKEGSANDIILEPVYGLANARRRPATFTETSYLKGIKWFRIILNGKPI
jgi:hypothetical protein